MRGQKRQALCPKWVDEPRTSAERHPALVDQQFDGAIFGLVIHLPAVLDPVPEVHGLQAETRCFADLPENRVAPQAAPFFFGIVEGRSEEHTSELQSLMRISYAVFCL